MITVVFTEEEALSLSIAGRAMEVAYKNSGVMTEEAYIQLIAALEKLDLVLWGPKNADKS